MLKRVHNTQIFYFEDIKTIKIEKFNVSTINKYKSDDKSPNYTNQ